MKNPFIVFALAIAFGSNTVAVENLEFDPPPGAKPYSETLRQTLTQLLNDRGDHYEPRTEHLRKGGSPKYVNRLILEDSPYLVQHAHNPVNWYSWGAEAFETATKENKPVFLSIGYSTCHWCHVMERESFDNEEIAEFLNKHFIAVKVDREQRPDLDEIYMTAVQLMTGGGGWPMSSFLTPQREPFFGATYFPPQQFAELLERVRSVWSERREDVVATATQVTAAIEQVAARRQEAKNIDDDVIRSAIDALVEYQEMEYPGQAPKFPREAEVLLLLNHAARTGNKDALNAATTKLDDMARGGIFDHAGGGFHRYSVDADWLVPHFEKMLYTQALLIRSYTIAYQLTGNAEYERVARQTLKYLLRDMTSNEGAFYSATDADSEGSEGEFFIWTPDEVVKILDKTDAEFAMDIFGVSETGNFEGKNILNLEISYEEYASKTNVILDALLVRVNKIKETLRLARENREHPLRDDKIVTSWNAMTITALVTAYEVFGEQRYLDAAVRAVNYLWQTNRSDSGELYRASLNDAASINATQEDYAYLAEALLSLYDVSGDNEWLNKAKDISNRMLREFWDNDDGGFFMAMASTDPLLITQPKNSFDNAMPSGNSVALRTLAMLAARTDNAEYLEKAEATLAAFSGVIHQQPAAYTYMLVGADELLSGAVGTRQFAAKGNVAAHAAMNTPEEIAITLDIKPGWHINSHKPLQDYLKATNITLNENADDWEIESIEFPEHQTVTLGFQDEPLAVYENTIRVTARLNKTSDTSADFSILPLELQVQACNDEICLLPENIVLEIPQAGSH